MDLNQEKIADRLIKEAISLHASDVHIEPELGHVRVRVRVDGLLQELHQLPLQILGTITTQLKLSSGMDISEKRVPQDGRYSIECSGRRVDLRLATLPTVLGEKVVIRILDREWGFLAVSGLNFTDANLDRFSRLYNAANGIVLVTGPTGSGKSTTLYAALAELDDVSKNIITVEDPVEYGLPGINQVALNRKAGMSFSGALRSILRQDPDVLMLGEIRDGETAALAVQAALTGHLLLSTLHTNNAVGAVSRLVDMGVERYLLAASMRGILAQRLVRRNCIHCAEKRPATAAELVYLGRGLDEEVFLYHGRGCAHCHGTGYAGRIAIQEVMLITEAVRTLIIQAAGDREILQEAERAGFTDMYADGAAKVEAGLTTVEELLRMGIHKGGANDDYS